MLLPPAAGADLHMLASGQGTVASLFLFVAGLVTGFVDSIAGGGGLISLPSISLVVGPGVEAIGTNKIVGLSAALVALFVYARHGHVDWRRSLLFTVFTGLGALIGSQVAPLLPPRLFPWLLAITCPVILYIVWKKDLWVTREIFPTHVPPRAAELFAVVASGVCCGFYDGVWGPGGGTFMFLSLLFVARLPLLTALAASKLANSMSAGTALVSYALSGHVHPWSGILVAAGTLFGGYVGANQASRRSSRIVRPVLATVVTLLVVKLIADSLHA